MRRRRSNATMHCCRLRLWFRLDHTLLYQGLSNVFFLRMITTRSTAGFERSDLASLRRNRAVDGGHVVRRQCPCQGVRSWQLTLVLDATAQKTILEGSGLGLLFLFQHDFLASNLAFRRSFLNVWRHFTNRLMMRPFD